MQWIKTTFHKFLDQLQTPGFAVGTALTTLGAVIVGLGGQALQSSLNLPIVAIYLMTGIALICLVFVGKFLERVVALVDNSEKRIEKMVEKHNYTRFITSKTERLDLMIHCINNATKSIYIISDLSGTEETQTDEHKKYLKALNQVLEYKNVEVKRIVMPPYTNGKYTEVASDWVYSATTTEAYREHFKLLQKFDNYAMSHTNVPFNVSMILIDNKYLFWKPELTYGDQELEKLFDGGLYWEDYTLEGLAHFIKTFEKLEKKARWTDPAKAPWTKPDKFDSKKTRKISISKESITMANISTDIQVWFLRHGKPLFNYKTDQYEEFMEVLCNGFSKPLVAQPEIDFKSLPKQVDFVGYSRFRRASETAKLLENKISVKHMEEMPSLDEVRFDKDIISEDEFKSLEQIRPKILERWYNYENKAESFNDSLARVKEIESFLSKRQEKTIILITHGWFLRILDLYFVQGNHTPTIVDLHNAKRIPLGHSIMAKVPRKRLIGAQMDLGGNDFLNGSLIMRTNTLAMQITEARARFLAPVIS